MPAPKPPFLINRDFALLWFGQAVSNIGAFVLTTTLVLWIATRLAQDQPWAPLAVGGISLAVSLPTLLIGPLAGVFVDRWDKRRSAGIERRCRGWGTPRRPREARPRQTPAPRAGLAKRRAVC